MIRLKHILELASDHEEADTKLVALVHDIQIYPGLNVLIRSSSVDIDILVLFLLYSDRPEDIRWLVDTGTGKNRKIIDMSTTGLAAIEYQSLAGIHAFQEIITFPAFFEKEKNIFGKKFEVIYIFWKLLQILEEEMDPIKN